MRVFGWIATGVFLMIAALVFFSVASIFVAFLFLTGPHSRVVASQNATQSVTLDGTQAEMVYTLPASSVSTVNVLPLLILVFCFFAVMAIIALALFSIAKGRRPNLDPGETDLLQSMYTGLSGMEQRLEALETLILEKKA
jgi:hypothetical protein